MSEPLESQSKALAGLVDRSISRHDGEELQRYVDMLVGPAVRRGLLGPREAERIWDRHILNCAALAPLLPKGGTVADIGSGAGLPGVVLALLRPDVALTLIEPLLRRTAFLTEVLTELHLAGRVTVVRERAEDYRGPPFDVVVARAVAPLDRLAGWALPLLRPGGTLLAVKGQRADAEVELHRVALHRLGARSVDVTSVGADYLDVPTTVVVVAVDGRGRRDR